MSDQPQGPGWWRASDGKFYPPQSAPDQPAPPPTDTTTTATTDAAPPTTSIFKKWWFWVLVVLGLVILIGLVTGGGDTDDTATTATPTPEATATEEPAPPETPEPTPTPTEEPEPEPSFEAQSYSGTGDGVVRIPEPIVDVVIVTTTHTGGDGNVIVEGLDANGEDADLLANGIGGEFQATRLTNFRVGTTLAAMEVTAPGDWTIDIKPLTDARRWDASADLTGQWDDVIIIEDGSFSALDSLVYDAQGDSNFLVEVYTEDGSGDLVVNDIAPAQGEGFMPSDPLVMQVSTGDGQWTLRKGSG